MKISIFDTVTSAHPDFVVLTEFNKLRSQPGYVITNPGTLVAYLRETTEGLQIGSGRVLSFIEGSYNRTGVVVLDEDGTRSDVMFDQMVAIKE